MATINFKQDFRFPDQSVYHHEARDLWLTRIIAGVTFPGSQPGYISVVGEELSLRPPGRMFLVGECEDFDLSSLILKGLQLQKDLNIQGFYSRITASVDHFIRIRNETALNSGMPEFRVSTPPHCNETGGFDFHLNLLKENLRGTNKTLHLSKESRLPAYLNDLPQMIHDLKDFDYPAVSSLAYAVSTLSVYPYRANRQQTFAKMEYDLFSD